MKTITKQIRAERRAKAEKMAEAYNKLTLEQKIAKWEVILSMLRRARRHVNNTSPLLN